LTSRCANQRRDFVSGFHPAPPRNSQFLHQLPQEGLSLLRKALSSRILSPRATLAGG